MAEYFSSLDKPLLLVVLSVFLFSKVVGRKNSESLALNPVILEGSGYRDFRQLAFSVSAICNVLCVYVLLILLNGWFSFAASTLSDFTSIYELAFGLNIILYLFNILPNYKENAGRNTEICCGARKGNS